MNLLTLPEAGRRLGCSRGHVYDLIAAGHLRRFDISANPKATKTRVSDDDVTAYIERCQRPVAAPAAAPRLRSA